MLFIICTRGNCQDLYLASGRNERRIRLSAIQSALKIVHGQKLNIGVDESNQ